MNEKTLGAFLPWLLLGAVLTALTLIFPQIGLFEWLTMVPMAAGLYRLCERESCTLRRAYGFGFLTVYVFYFVIYHWFTYLYPLDFVDMDNTSSAIVVGLAWMGLPLIPSAVGGLVFLAFRWLYQNQTFVRLPLLRPFAFAALWTVFEWTTSLTWAGVPWGRLALGQVEVLPLLQSISLFGSYFVTFLIVLVNALIAYAILYAGKALLCGGLAGAIFAFNLGIGLLIGALPQKSEQTLTAAVIQGNIDSHDKWGSESYRITVEAYERLTKQAAASGAELVIWPESVFPNELNYRPHIQYFLSDLARECDITMVIGAFYGSEEEDSDTYYNALFLIEPDGTIHEEYYAKRHLVPFGEYVPMRELIMTVIPPLAELSALDDDVTPGEGSSLFESPWGKLGSLICFDSIYENLALESVRDGAELMIISSNDNWFYDSAAVYQHLAQAQLRAIETGRYYLRAASTGISAIISPDGEILGSTPPLEEGYNLAEVSTVRTNTLYTHIGNLFVYLCILFCAAVLFLGGFLTNLLCKRK